MTPYEQIAQAIIKKIASIMGEETAKKHALRVSGLSLNDDGTVKIARSPRGVLEDLINQYRSLSGPAAIIFCQSAARPILEKNPGLDLPEILQVRI